MPEPSGAALPGPGHAGAGEVSRDQLLPGHFHPADLCAGAAVPPSGPGSASAAAMPPRGTRQKLNGRRGRNLTIRVTPEEEEALLARKREFPGPDGLGPWVIWRALDTEPPRARQPPLELAMAPSRSRGHCRRSAPPPVSERIILDLCGGSGSWSAPYREKGYRVELVTLPDQDVRLYAPPSHVWGILAAPPCDQFSLARQGHGDRAPPADFVRGMETVSACLRIVFQARLAGTLQWWALENPVGHLSKWLGTPRDVWQPHDFGHPYTKRTAIWGEFEIPKRGPFVAPQGGFHSLGWRPEETAVTPAGFAQAFAEANP